jgi:hypothetical protein
MCIATCDRLLCVLGFGDLPKYTGALIFQERFTLGDSSQTSNPANFEFSKTEQMHDLVIGLFVNRYEFGRVISHEIHNSETPSLFGYPLKAGQRGVGHVR